MLISVDEAANSQKDAFELLFVEWIIKNSRDSCRNFIFGFRVIADKDVLSQTLLKQTHRQCGDKKFMKLLHM